MILLITFLRHYSLFPPAHIWSVSAPRTVSSLSVSPCLCITDLSVQCQLLSVWQTGLNWGSQLLCQAELGPVPAPGSVRRMWSHPGSPDIRCAGLAITRTGPTPGCRVTVSADLWQHRLYTAALRAGWAHNNGLPGPETPGGRGLKWVQHGGERAVTEPRSLNFMSLTDISGASCSANICSSKIERGGRERNVLMTFITEISLESADVSCDTCDSLPSPASVWPPSTSPLHCGKVMVTRMTFLAILVHF